MATYSSGRIRQGLPRSPGGPAWPDADGAVLAELVAAEPVTTAPEPVILREAAESPSSVPLRRGLPRIAGGEPWPAAGTADVSAPAPVAAAAPQTAATVAPAAVPAAAGEAAETTREVASVAPRSVDPEPSKTAHAAAASAPKMGAETETEEVTLRRGLPREPGAEPWPPAGTVTVQRTVAPQTAPETRATAETPPAVDTVRQPAADASFETPEAPNEDSATSRRMTGAATPIPAPTSQPAATPEATPASPAQPSARAEVSTPAQPSKPATKPKREAIMIGTRTLGQWARLVVVWGIGAILAAGIIVLAARGVTTLPGAPEFLRRFPGEYDLPDFVTPGFPAWARWSHFFNFFLIVLIIRSGLLVRTQQKPDAFFTPKKGGKKVSIYHWMHTSLDVLWLLNGIVFVVLLFASGHWARIVPTSWEVFPNAASAMLQYLTLEWPVEDGWVNYNSLQQLMYFVVVFIAAPLAAITGVRMSQWWPENAERLNRAYPAPIARALHFPTMLFFVLFIIIHVFLVLTTGALRNLNHMFAGTPEISWLGFWWFVAAVFVTAAVTWAARPLVLAPIANAFGRVSQR